MKSEDFVRNEWLKEHAWTMRRKRECRVRQDAGSDKFVLPEGQLKTLLVVIIFWRSVRVAEGARLESVYTVKRIEGSNPSFSAI